MEKHERTENSFKKRTAAGMNWLLVVMMILAAVAAERTVAADEQLAEELSEQIGDELKEGVDIDIAAEQIHTLSFKKDMGIRDALRVLSARYQKNIVPSTNVDGAISVTQLYGVSFEEALDAILGHQFKYEQQGSFIKVYTAAEYEKIKKDKSRMQHQVYTLYYISAAEAIRLITPVLSEAGLAQGSSPAEVGVSSGEDGVGSLSGGDSLALNDKLVVFDYPENVEKATKLIESIDVKPLQVLIEATILSAKLTEDMKLGVDLNLLSGTTVNAFANTLSGSGTPTATTGFAEFTGSGLKIAVSAGDFQGFISALEEITDATVLANPKILALNKQVGTVFIGERLGYKSSTTQSEIGETQEVEFLESGTKLSFRPYIGNDGYIRMDIYPKDSSAELVNELPQETTTELSTNIMVKDGQMIAIGGLFRDDITVGRKQVPLLGDLPLVGAAFRQTDDSNERQEVIVLLKPTIIKEPSDANGDIRADDISRKRYGTADGLQWQNRGVIAEANYAQAVKLYTQGKKAEALAELDEALLRRPAYLEALRLKDKIISETAGSSAVERIMIDKLEAPDTAAWIRK